MTKLPDRFMPSQKYSLDVSNLFSDEQVSMLGQWLHAKRDRLVYSEPRTRWWMYADDCPVGSAVRRILDEHLIEAASKCGVRLESDAAFSEIYATLFHHGCGTAWIRDYHEDSTRLLSWELVLHQPNPLFSGGEREWYNGDEEKVGHLRMNFWNSLSLSRVREVECWSARHIHGRWSLYGFVNSQAVVARPEPAVADDFDPA